MVEENIHRIAPQVKDIHAPAPIRDLPLWCTWRMEVDPEGGKGRKVPYYSFGGRRVGKQGSPEDRAKLTTFAVAKAEAAKRGLTPLARNEWICWTIFVKNEETREAHIKRMVGELKEGKRRPCCWLGCIHRKDKKISPSVAAILKKKRI